MSAHVWSVVLAVLMLNGKSLCFPSGAPSITCGIYMPHHGAAPQPPSSNPYAVVASSRRYNIEENGGQIEVNVTSLSGKEEFKGFVVAAYDEDQQPFGYFLPSHHAHQIPHCDKQNNAHSKKLVTLFWRPPTEGAPTTGAVIFKATVVRSYHHFWVNIISTNRADIALSST